MKKRLKTEKRKNKKLIIVFLFVLISTYSFYAFLNFIYLKYIQNDNAIIVDTLLDNALGSINIANLDDLKSPSFIIKYILNQNITSVKENSPVDILPMNIDSKTIVYIYNSHPTEGYSNSSLENYSINPTVITADYILKEYLEQEGISSLVEEKSAADILKQNNWKYGYSYKASRILLESAYMNNQSLEYFIDIHRDSAAHDVTTTEIDGKKYAKLLFVIGMEYDTYLVNLKMADTINEMIKEKYPSLTRGVLKKKGAGVNGVYNQDFNKNCILIEIGGYENTIEEINNTIKVLAKVIATYIGENHD